MPKCYLLIILILSSMCGSLLHAQGSIELESKSIPTNTTTFTIAVEANGFPIDIASLDFTLQYNTGQVRFNGIVNQNLPPIFGSNEIGNNRLKVSWFDFSTVGVSAVAPTTLFEIEFALQPGVSNGTTVTIDYFVNNQNPQEVGLVTGLPATGTSFSPAIISVGTFPVTWASFEAEVQPDRSVALDWATAQEVNNDYFEVERRTAEGDFQAIGRMGGAGNADQETRYRFVDPQPFSGENYYRIRQVDFDGSFSYSEVQVANLQKSQWLQAYPNPVGTTLTLELPETAETFRLDWLDATGRVVRQDQLSGGAGAGEVSLEVSDLPAGVYQLRLQSPAGQVYLSSVVKQ